MHIAHCITTAPPSRGTRLHFASSLLTTSSFRFDTHTVHPKTKDGMEWDTDLFASYAVRPFQRLEDGGSPARRYSLWKLAATWKCERLERETRSKEIEFIIGFSLQPQYTRCRTSSGTVAACLAALKTNKASWATRSSQSLPGPERSRRSSAQ